MTSPTVTHSTDARIAAALATGSGVASEHRLRTRYGVSRRAIRRRIGTGVLVEVLPRTYARVGVAHLDATARMAAAAASLQHHPGIVAFTSAARVLGIWDRGRDRVAHALSTTRWRPSAATWVDYHHTESLPPGDVVDLDGMHVTSVIRTCLDLGTCLTEWQLTHVLWEAEFLHGLDLAELERRNDERPGFRGCDVVRRAIAHRRAGSAGSRSGSEDYLLEGIVRAGLPLPMVCNPNATQLQSIECDLVWRAARLVVEVDGPGHRRTGRAERDAAQVRQLRAAGWLVVRISTEELWADRDAVVARIAAHLAGWCRR